MLRPTSALNINGKVLVCYGQLILKILKFRFPLAFLIWSTSIALRGLAITYFLTILRAILLGKQNLTFEISASSYSLDLLLLFMASCLLFFLAMALQRFDVAFSLRLSIATSKSFLKRWYVSGQISLPRAHRHTPSSVHFKTGMIGFIRTSQAFLILSFNLILIGFCLILIGVLNFLVSISIFLLLSLAFLFTISDSRNLKISHDEWSVDIENFGHNSEVLLNEILQNPHDTPRLFNDFERSLFSHRLFESQFTFRIAAVRSQFFGRLFILVAFFLLGVGLLSGWSDLFRVRQEYVEFELVIMFFLLASISSVTTSLGVLNRFSGDVHDLLDILDINTSDSIKRYGFELSDEVTGVDLSEYPFLGEIPIFYVRCKKPSPINILMQLENINGRFESVVFIDDLGVMLWNKDQVGKWVSKKEFSTTVAVKTLLIMDKENPPKVEQVKRLAEHFDALCLLDCTTNIQNGEDIA